MKNLNHTQVSLVAGGSDSCHDVTLELLDSCSLQQMGLINAVFKSVILSDDLKDASPEAVKAALIGAILNTEF